MKKYLVYFALLSIFFNPIRAANSLEGGMETTCIMMINQVVQETPEEFYDEVYDYVIPLKQIVNQTINILIPQINEHVADIENKYGDSPEEYASSVVTDARRTNTLWFEILHCMRTLERANIVLSNQELDELQKNQVIK